MEEAIIISGSARKNGDTQRLLELVNPGQQLPHIPLIEKKIYPYDYTGSYPPDDQFHQVIEKTQAYRTIILVTPVYWYAMSGLMKTFFDRLTDLVTIHKHIGRQFRGKRIVLLSVGSDSTLPEGFEVPFRKTAVYLDMSYAGSFYVRRSALDFPDAIKTKEWEILLSPNPL